MQRTLRTTWPALLALLALIAGGAVHAQGGDPTVPGVITYALPDGGVYRLAAEEGAEPEDISAALDTLAPGADEWLNLSPGGDWLLLSTERFDPQCEGWPCLAVVSADLSSVGYTLHTADGTPLRSEGFGAIASGGGRVVFAAGDGPNTLDLWVTERGRESWSEPVALTADSPFAYHTQPAIAADGTRVLFDCGPTPYSQEGTAICEVGIDGSGFRVVAAPDTPPEGVAPGEALHHADYTPDGGIVFEADWDGGEAIWLLPADSAPAYRPDPAFTNDNSPCVLPDGRIVSLWLNRAGGPGYHEIKIMDPATGGYTLALIEIDVLDAGLGCGAGDAIMTGANADVTYVRAVQDPDGTWTFHVTVAHPDTGWEDYADGWDVVLPDGTVVKPDPDSPFTRLLLHPHQNEQPFTRSQRGIAIPPEVTQVTVRAHDLVDGWGGREVTVDLTADSGPGFEVQRAE